MERIGHYEIIRLLGRGGMGEVYLAKDLQLGRNVALKLIPQELARDEVALSRFRREATSVATMNHPNICSIHEIGEDNGRVFICMEYIEGESLQQRLQRKSLSLEETLNIGIQIAEALDQARKKGIVHRDIKPANIMLTEGNRVKILDFGLAKPHLDPEAIEDAPTAAHVTQTGVTLGTPAYMSPEQALGKPVDHRSDIFSFGIVLYQCVTNRLPFSGNSSTAVIDSILHSNPHPITPDWLNSVIQKMLAKDPEYRYQSAHEVWIDLKQQQQKKEPQRRQAYAAIATAILILMIGTGLWLMRKQQPSTAEVKSIVALPCKVYGEKNAEYLTDAVPATLSTLLAEVNGVEMKVPPTSFEVESVHGDLRKIADAYDAESFVLTSVMADPNRLVLNVQVADSHTRKVLWSKEYEGKPSDYIDLSHQAADGIREFIAPNSLSSGASSMLGNTSEAELAFRQGKYYSNRYNNLHKPADFDLSFTALKRALELDPGLAESAGEISMLYNYKAEGGAAPDFQAMQTWGQRGVKINPRCYRAWNGLLAAEFWRPDFDTQRILDLALKTASFGDKDSKSQLALASALQCCSSKLWLESSLKARSLDPLFLYPPMNAALALLSLGRSQEALTYVNEVLAIEPEMNQALWSKSLILSSLGRPQKAEDIQELADFLKNGQIMQSMWLSAQYAYDSQQGQADLADKITKGILQFTDNPQTSALDQNLNVMFIAPVLARNAKKDAAIHVLQAGAKAKVLPLDILLLNPDFRSLNGDPRFEQVLASARFELDKSLHIFDKARGRGEFPQYLEKPLADLLKKLNYQQ